ncbi:MAG: hypoxanthine phosphoribosyltransferase [Eubacterium sp.]|nr:hypoxanthine phosphoribosyltransferase [Eubacterium sp.]
MKENIKEILIDAETIQAKVAEIGARLSEDYKDKNPIAICILKGSVIFFADLIREIKVPVEIDFIKASSYGRGTESSGKVEMAGDLSIDVAGRSILLVEDIVDSGNTLKFFTEFFKEKGASEVKICTLLDKPERRVVDLEADYTCFEIPDEFVVGYGLDYAQQYRNMPEIGILKESCYM